MIQPPGPSPTWWNAGDRSRRQIVSPPRIRSADAYPNSIESNNADRIANNDTREQILKHRVDLCRYHASVIAGKHAESESVVLSVS